MFVERVELRVSLTSDVSAITYRVYSFTCGRIIRKTAFTQLHQSQLIVLTRLSLTIPVTQNSIQSQTPFFEQAAQSLNLVMRKSKILN